MVTLLSAASARSSCTSFSDNGQYFAQSTAATQSTAAATSARMMRILRRFLLVCDRCASGVEVRCPTTSIDDDMKLGVPGNVVGVVVTGTQRKDQGADDVFAPGCFDHARAGDD